MNAPAPTFLYKASNQDGRILTGHLRAASRNDALIKLRAQGLIPCQLQVLKTVDNADTRRHKTDSARPRVHFATIRRSHIKLVQLAAAFSQIADLLEAGMPLDRTLAFMHRLQSNRLVALIAESAYNAVRSGHSLSEAFAEATQVCKLPTYVIPMIRAGEAAGNLEKTLRMLSELCERQGELQSRVRASLTYPAFMFGATLGAVYFLIAFILPRFSSIFDNLNDQLPFTTQILISIAAYVHSFTIPGGVLIVGLLIFGPVALKKDSVRRFIDSFVLKLPVIGSIIRDTLSARLAWALAAMLSGGVPLLQALRVAHDIIANVTMSTAVKIAIIKVQQGVNLSTVWKETGAFPEMFVELVAVGEETGEPARLMRQAALVLDNQVRTKLKSITTLLEPVLVLLMAIMVGTVVVAILAPIVQLNELAF